MTLQENMLLDGKVLWILDAAPSAAAGDRGHVRLDTCHLLQVQARFLLLGTRVLEPDLENAFCQTSFYSFLLEKKS